MRLLVCTLAMLLLSNAALGQTTQFASGNNSISITTGNTFQLIAPARQSMRSLTVQNNNSADNCWIDVTGAVATGAALSSNITTAGGATITAQKGSILLGPGQSYSRYYPYLPLGPINGTCATAGDSIYVDWQ